MSAVANWKEEQPRRRVSSLPAATVSLQAPIYAGARPSGLLVAINKYTIVVPSFHSRKIAGVRIVFGCCTVTRGAEISIVQAYCWQN